EHRHRRVRAWLGAADDARQISRPFDRATVEAQDHVAWLYAGFRSRPFLRDRVDQRTARRRTEADRLRDFLRNTFDPDANAAADHAPGRAQLLLHVHRLVDRNRERDAVVAARGREDLRIDSDDLAAHVEQRSTGVAGIYGDVRLDERQELARIARFGADDAGSDRVVQAERRA